MNDNMLQEFYVYIANMTMLICMLYTVIQFKMNDYSLKYKQEILYIEQEILYINQQILQENKKILENDKEILKNDREIFKLQNESETVSDVDTKYTISEELPILQNDITLTCDNLERFNKIDSKYIIEYKKERFKDDVSDITWPLLNKELEFEVNSEAPYSSEDELDSDFDEYIFLRSTNLP